MNVSLAAQTFSRSVANSINFCREKGCAAFENSEPTAKFTGIANELFDIFNSKIGQSKRRKSPFNKALSKQNSELVLKFLETAKEYLYSLRIGGRQIVNTKNQTGFKGFLINIESLKNIYNMYVATDLLENVPTYHLSHR